MTGLARGAELSDRNGNFPGLRSGLIIEGVGVVPRCHYARRWLRSHHEYLADVHWSAAGLIVTRTSDEEDRHLGDSIRKQLGAKPPR